MNDIKQVYEIFLRQLYTLPINQTYFPMNFISISDVKTLLQQKQISRYEIDPLLQVWAGSTPQRNRIITLYTKDGRTYLVKALYNSKTQEINEPTI